jgi:hypothetical protein
MPQKAQDAPKRANPLPSLPSRVSRKNFRKSFQNLQILVRFFGEIAI